MTFPESPQAAFPVLRRLLYDAFSIEAWLLQWPYANLDKIDRSIRRTLWGEDFYTLKDFSPLAGQFSVPQTVIFKSSLGFYNIICLLSDSENPDVIAAGPFRDREITPSFLDSIVRENHLSADSLAVIQNFYSTLPLADPEAAASFLSHFLSLYFPDYGSSAPLHISFSEPAQTIVPDEDLLFMQSYQYAEQYADEYRSLTDALCSGQPDSAVRSLRSFLALTGMLREPGLPRLCRNLTVLNELFASAVLSCPVPPVYIRKLAREIQFEIDTASSGEILRALAESMLQRYCALVKNQAYAEYSSLTRKIINYISFHLSEELSLSILARLFHRHPSALSSYFRKETGLTLTAFIRRERLRRASEYLSASSLEIRDIALLTGFHDLGYFCRVFKKQTGLTPGAYRKLFSLSKN